MFRNRSLTYKTVVIKTAFAFAQHLYLGDLSYSGATVILQSPVSYTLTKVYFRRNVLDAMGIIYSKRPRF